MNDKELKAAQAVCDAATPGPKTWTELDWSCEGPPECPCRNEHIARCEAPSVFTGAGVSEIFSIDAGDYFVLDDNDAEFVAKAYTLLPQALAEIRRLREALTHYEVITKHIHSLDCGALARAALAGAPGPIAGEEEAG